MGQQLLLELLALGSHLRVGLQPLGEVEHAGLHRPAHGVVRVGGEVVEEAAHAGVHLGEDAIVDRIGHPPRRLLRQPGPERVAVVLHEVAGALEHGVEEALVVAALTRRGRSPDRPAVTRPWPARAARPSARAQLDTSPSSSTLIVFVSTSATRRCGAVRVLLLAEPLAEPAGDACAAQSLTDHLARHEVALDELAEGTTDLVLAVGDDRRVRDRQAERMAEQRGHREPIGERARPWRPRRRLRRSPRSRARHGTCARTGTRPRRRPAARSRRTSFVRARAVAGRSPRTEARPQMLPATGEVRLRDRGAAARIARDFTTDLAHVRKHLGIRTSTSHDDIPQVLTERIAEAGSAPPVVAAVGLGDRQRRLLTLRSPQPLRIGGNTNDHFDAYVLADTLRTDGHRWTRLREDRGDTKALRAPCGARRELVAIGSDV